MGEGGGMSGKVAPRQVRYCECGDHAFSPLTKGCVALVSPEDAILLHVHWRVHKDTRTPGKYRTVLSPDGGAFILSRVIVRAPKGAVVDHSNGDTTDNRRPNLRVGSHSDNSANLKCHRDGTKTLPPGVQQISRRFKVTVHRNGQRRYLGYFDTVEEAICARDKAVLEMTSPRLEEAA